MAASPTETTKRVELGREAIAEIVRGLDPIDWVQLRVTAQLSPTDQISTGIRVADFARAIVRGALAERFPDLTRSELNMKVLRHFTTVRMDEK